MPAGRSGLEGGVQLITGGFGALGRSGAQVVLIARGKWGNFVATVRYAYRKALGYPVEPPAGRRAGPDTAMTGIASGGRGGLSAAGCCCSW